MNIFAIYLNRLLSAFEVRLVRTSTIDSLNAELQKQIARSEILGTHLKEQETKNAILEDNLQRLKSNVHFFPIYVVNEHTQCLNPHRGEFDNKVAVFSIPKSGTYLLAEILKQIGYVDTEVHLRVPSVSDYRGKLLDERRKAYLHLTFDIDASEIARLVLNGQFIVGHMPYNDHIKTVFNNFRIIFSCRELRDTLVSAMRFMSKRHNPDNEAWTNVPDGPERLVKFLDLTGGELITWYRTMAGWLADPNVLSIRFERLLGDGGEDERHKEIRRICEYLGVADSISVDTLVHSCFGVETLTWSGKRTDKAVYWSDEAESLFQKLGGDKINNLLSYDI